MAFSGQRPLDRDTAIERTIAALRAAGILRADDRIELVHTEEIEPAYVIYDLDHRRNVADHRLEVDEPLVEVSTDKVDTEIPSPVAGTLSKILVQEGDTVAVLD